MKDNQTERYLINSDLLNFKRKLNLIFPDPRNARKHGKHNLESIRKSYAGFKQQKPIVVREDGQIIAGNGQYFVAKALGWTHIAAVTFDGTDEQAKAFGIADNQTGLTSEWDEDLLSELVTELDDDLRDLLGFDEGDLNKILGQTEKAGNTDPDNVPSDVEPISQTGDLWILGEHRLLCGDSTIKEDVERLMGEDKPFMMVTDPPYGVEYDPGWRHEQGLNNSERIGKVQNDDRVDWSDAYKLFGGEVAYVWHADKYASDVIMSLIDSDLHPRSQVIWAKPRFAISRGHYHWQHEPCWYAVRKGKTSRWCGDRSQSTLWQIDLKQDDTDKVHGTQKPVECMARPIRNHGAKGDIIYEPFCGSGTTVIACEQLERKCRAIEIEPLYVDIAVKRWENFTGQKAIHEKI